MMDEPKYKRVLLKISGEALAGDKHFGLDFQVMGQVADVIREPEYFEYGSIIMSHQKVSADIRLLLCGSSPDVIPEMSWQ